MNNKIDLISIGLPTYNAAQYISRCLSSLLNQSYHRFELIISDDASTDKTSIICQQFTKKDKRIKYMRQKKNLGFVKNFNFVLKKARGKYFVWAGNDDYWDKNYLLKLHQLHKKYPDIVLAVSKFNNVYQNKPYNYMKNQKINNNLPQLSYLFHYIVTRNISYFYGLHKTNILKKTGGYHKDSRPYFRSSDYITIFKVLLEGKLAYINETLFFKRDTGNFTKQYEIVKEFKFNKTVLNKIIRFLCFPIYYTFDLYFCSKYTLISSLNILKKLNVLIFVFYGFIKYQLEYLYKVFMGLIFLFNGSLKKLFHYE